MGGVNLNRAVFFVIIVLYAGGGMLCAQDADITPGQGSGAAAALPPESSLIFGETVPSAAVSGGASAGAVIRMVLVLALAAAAIYGVVFFLRRAARPQEQYNPHLKILSSAHLGSNRFMYVISVGAQAWLVGAGEGGVSLIAEIGDKEAVDAMILARSQRSAEAGRFADFRALLHRLSGGPGGDEPGGNPRPDNLRRRRERLKGL